VWGAAGVCRAWLPGPIQEHLRDQWWAADQVPSDEAVRTRIATFWTGVVPWLAWNPNVPPLPDPPADPALNAAILSGLRQEIERCGSPVLGRERLDAFAAAVRRIERLDRPARSA
jgi:hypothetical protein